MLANAAGCQRFPQLAPHNEQCGIAPGHKGEGKSKRNEFQPSVADEGDEEHEECSCGHSGVGAQKRSWR